jgi:uncharacterized repeat protein (TIGR02543 family)
MPSNISAVYDSSFKLGAAPSLTGWTFGGWYSDAACTKKVGGAGDTAVNLTSTLNGTVNLYAKWTANTYTVKYDKNGGSGSMGNVTHTYDTAKKLTKNTFTRANYTFLGWSTSANAVTPTYKDEASVSTLATSGTVTLYAVWVKTKYSVHKTGLNQNIRNNDNDYSIVISPGFDIADLKANGYKTLKLHFHFKGRATNPVTFNTPRLRIYSNTDKEVYNGTHNAFEGSWGAWTWRDVYYDLSIDNVDQYGQFWAMWSTSGGSASDGWCLDEYEISIEVVK